MTYPLTGLQRAYLETVRARRTADDEPTQDLAADLDPDGMVRFRPATLSEQVDRMVAKWVWEAAEGDVA